MAPPPFLMHRVKFLCTVLGVPTDTGEQTFLEGQETLVDETSYLVLKGMSLFRLGVGLTPWIIDLDGDAS